LCGFGNIQKCEQTPICSGCRVADACRQEAGMQWAGPMMHARVIGSCIFKP
jgi:hypothetical protein